MDSPWFRRLRPLLALLAVVYAAFACLHTIGDFDTGWQLATGRYHFQHHAIPSSDVLSYTSAGAPWIYPPFAGAIFYAIYVALGYAGLTWFCVLTAAVLAGWLLQRALPQAAWMAAALLILAVPSLAYRLSPRADLFTTVFFAMILAELWRFHCGERAGLWMLPPIMFLWVNLHPGFIAGLGLLAGYLLMELLSLPFRDLRRLALERLAKAWPWLAGGAAATLLNPWGVHAVGQALALARLDGASSATPRFIGEFSSAPLSWHVLWQAFDLRNPDSSFWWLVAVAVTSAAIAVWKREFGAALLLAASLAAALQRLRYQGLFAIVVVLVGGVLLTQGFAALAGIERPRFRLALRWASLACVALLFALTGLRLTDLLSNRQYIVSASITSFGPGESSWFPERAAAFIEREKLPGNLFQPYNLGGFTALRLGPAYPDYIDGRGVSAAVSAEEQLLISQPPDSPAWQRAATERNINVILLSLARYGGLNTFDLDGYCRSSAWQPVYMDEVSLVLLRRTPQNQPWIDRLAINCRTAPLEPPAQASRDQMYNFFANAGAVEYALARDAEAENSWRKALLIAPEDPSIHLFLAQLDQQRQSFVEAEREYRASLALRETSTAWYALGRMLAGQHRYADAESAIAKAIPLTSTPANQYKALAQVELRLNKAEQAESNLLEAERQGPPASDLSPNACEFRAQIAEGHAEASRQLGNLPQAVALQQESVRQTPQSAGRWNKLAEIAAEAGERDVATDAARKASQLQPPAQR